MPRATATAGQQGPAAGQAEMPPEGLRRSQQQHRDHGGGEGQQHGPPCGPEEQGQGNQGQDDERPAQEADLRLTFGRCLPGCRSLLRHASCPPR